MQERNSNKLSRGDKINAIGVGVNAVIGVAAIAAFIIATCSYNLSKTAIADSDSTANKNYNLAVKVFDSTNSSNRKILDAQIAALKQEQQRSLIEKKPIIDAGAKVIQKPTEQQPAIFEVHCRNYGGYAAQVIQISSWIALGHMKVSCDSVYFNEDEIPDSANNTINANGDMHFQLTDTLRKDIFPYIQNGFYSYYILFYLKYQNIITKEIFEYKTIIKISPTYDGYANSCRKEREIKNH